MDAGSINAKVGIDNAQAVRALSDFSKEILKIPEFLKQVELGITQEELASRKSVVTKQQQIAAERELRAVKAQLAEALAGEDKITQAVAGKYNLLTNEQRAQIIETRQQIAVQAELTAARNRDVAAAERQAAAEINLARQKAIALALVGDQAKRGWEAALVGGPGGGGSGGGGGITGYGGGWDDPQQRAIAVALAGEEARKRQQQALSRLGPNLKTAGGFLTRNVTTPILGFGGAAIYAGNQVQSAEAGISAGTGLTGGALDSVSKSFERIAPQVSQPLAQVGQAVTELERRTGLTGKSLEELAVNELNLQRVTKATPGVVRETAQVFAAWNVPIAEQIPLLNQMMRAHQASGISVDKLAQAVSRFAPTMRGVGLSVSDSIGLFSAFEKANIAPERAVTAFNSALGKLAKAGAPDAGKALRDALERIQNTTNGTKALDEATRLFGARIGVNLVDALRTGKLNITQLLEAILHGNDTIEQAAKRTQTLSVVWGQMRNALEVALAPLGKVLIQLLILGATALKPVIDGIGRMADAFSKLSPAMQTFSAGALLVVAAIGPLLSGLGNVVVGATALKTAWVGMRAGMAETQAFAAVPALLSPIVLGITALSVVALAFATNWHGVRDDFVSGLQAMSAAFQVEGSKIQAGLGSLATSAAGLQHWRSLGQVKPADWAGWFKAGVGQVGDYLHGGEKSLGKGAGKPSRMPDYVHAWGNTPSYGAGELATVVAGDQSYLQMTGQGGFSVGGGTPAMDAATRRAEYGAGKKSPQEMEQKRYTEELTQARARLTEAMAGEDNIAQKVAAHYHLLSAAQREVLVGVLDRLQHQDELNKANDAVLKNTREVALLHRGLSPEVARLGGEYVHLSQGELQHVFASQKATEEAFKAAESQKSYTKDLRKTNAEIRRLKAGHVAAAGGIDELKDKYPGLTQAQYAYMQNAIETEKRMQQVHDRAAKLNGMIRDQAKAFAESTASTKAGKEAIVLFSDEWEKFLKKHPQGTAQQFWAGLTPAEQRRAKTQAGVIGDTALQGMATGLTEENEALSTGQRGQYMAQMHYGKNMDQLATEQYQRINDIVRRQDVNESRQAGFNAVNAPQHAINQLIGTGQSQLDRLTEQYSALTGKSSLARDAMQRFGVVLKDLPQQTQAQVRAIRDLSRTMEMFQQFTQGLQSIFEKTFTDLYQHGFKGFFANIIKGVNDLIGQIAAKFLAARLTDLFTNLLGGLIGGAFGGGKVDSGAYRTGYAGGGYMNPGAARWVGEQGPELFMPDVPGRVVPHTESMSTGGHTFIFNISSPDAASFRRSQGQLVADAYRHAATYDRRNR